MPAANIDVTLLCHPMIYRSIAIGSIDIGSIDIGSLLPKMIMQQLKKVFSGNQHTNKKSLNMNLEYKHLLPGSFHPSSRVWIYQSSRLFSIGEALEIEEMLNDFTETWQSHGAKVKGYANLFFGQFIILMADETQAGVSGCSTDSSVRLVKSIEETFKVDMFNRQNMAFLVKDKIQMLPLSQVKYAVENNFITSDTIYFNNLAQTKEELLTKWIIPVKHSWLAGKFLPKQPA